MGKKEMTFLVALAGMGLVGGSAFAQQPSTGTGTQGGSQMPSRMLGGAAEAKTATATIQSIDKEKRTVTLKDEKGKTMTVDVPSDVESFDRLKKGDKVTATYQEALAVSVHKPGEAKPTNEVQESTGRTTGANPSRTMERTHTMSAEVVSVDAAKNKLKVKGPEGKTRDINVEDPSMREKLKDLKPGEVVELQYTEAMAITLQPKK
jgi:hypothetical protein